MVKSLLASILPFLLSLRVCLQRLRKEEVPRTWEGVVQET